MMRRMRTSPGMLLAQGDFKKELKLAKDQDKAISEVLKNHQKELAVISKKAQQNPMDMSSFKDMDLLDERTNLAISQALKPDQAVRLRQHQFQVMDYGAYYEADMQAMLELTAEQKTKIDEFKAGESSRKLGIFQKTSGSGLTKAFKKLREESQGILIGMLTTDQVVKYKAALGPECKAAKKMAESVM